MRLNGVGTLIAALVLLGQGLGGCKGGPVLDPDVNVRNLCEKTVSGEDEDRCQILDPACATETPLCMDPPAGFDEDFGICRQCEVAAQCDVGLECDHGWCHETCAQDSECEAPRMCTGGFCRKPHFVDFAFTSNGDEAVEIDLAASRLLGDTDACAFTQFEWTSESPDDIVGDILTVQPGLDVFLRVYFRPTGVGFFRGRIDVVSNSTENNPLPMYLCGQSVEAECVDDVDGSCPECVANCTEADFEQVPATPPTCP